MGIGNAAGVRPTPTPPPTTNSTPNLGAGATSPTKPSTSRQPGGESPSPTSAPVDQFRHSGESDETVRPGVSSLIQGIVGEMPQTPPNGGNEPAPPVSEPTPSPTQPSNHQSWQDMVLPGGGESTEGSSDVPHPPVNPEPSEPKPPTIQTRPNGETITNFNNGMVFTTHKDGSSSQQTTYKKDGNTYVTTNQFAQDGTMSNSIAVTDQDGITRTTQSTTETLDQSFQDSTPGAPPIEAQAPEGKPQRINDADVGVGDWQGGPLALPGENEQDPVQRVHSTETITYPDGTVKPVSDTTTTSQQETTPDGQFSHEVSYTRGTTYDENGSPKSRDSWAYEINEEGTGEQGQHYTKSNETRVSIDPENPSDIEMRLSSETRGLATKDSLLDHAGDIGNQPDVLNRVIPDGEYTNVRNQLVIPHGGKFGSTTTTEIGDYDNPDADGQSARFTYQRGDEDSPNRTVNVRSVSDSGRNVDEQTLFPGHNATVTAHSRYEDDGSYTSDSTFKKDDQILQTTHSEGRQVDRSSLLPEVMPGFFPPVTPAARGDLRMAQDFVNNGQGNLVTNQTEVVNYKDGKPADTTGATSYTANDGQVLRVVEGPDGTTTAKGSADGSARVVDNQGHMAEQTPDGLITYGGENGRSHTLPTVPGYSAARTGTGGASAINDLAQVVNGQDGIDPGFSKRLGQLGLAFSAADVADSLAHRDVWGAVNAVGGSASNLLSMGDEIATRGAQGAGTAPRALQVLRGASKLAGPVAIGLSGADSVNKLLEGDKEGAVVAAGTTLGTAALAIGSRVFTASKVFSPVGWGILGVTGAYSFLDTFTQFPWESKEVPNWAKTAPIEI